MKDLRKELEQVLKDHQRENGSHFVGGSKRLVERLVAFFEEWTGGSEQDRSGSDSCRTTAESTP